MASAFTKAIAAFRPPPAAIRGLDSAAWMGPLQPVSPVAPAGTAPRGWEYFPGQNLIYTPRNRERLTAARLRELSLYPLARMAMENVKDQVLAKQWSVRLRRIPGETVKDRLSREKGDQTLAGLYRLLGCPNPDEDWRDWLRPVLDDAMVIDAPAVLLRRTTGGKLAELRHVDGATITRYVDENGWAPAAPNPAYAQLWFGIPSVDLTSDQLLYRPRNVPSYRLYGMSPTEQVSELIEVGIERLRFRAAYYREGSIPDAIQVVPPGVPPDQIRESQDWLTSDMAGQLAKRRQLRLVQGFNDKGADQFIFPKEPLLKDEYDDWEISMICFAYGSSRQRLVRQLSRGSAKQSQDAAEEEGLAPWLDWVSGLANRILRAATGGHDYEFVFAGFRETDVVKQSQADASDIRYGIRTINEVREDRGYEPRPEEAASALGIVTPTGFVPLEGSDDRDGAAGSPAPARNETAGSGDAGTGPQPTVRAAAGAGAGVHKATPTAAGTVATAAVAAWLAQAGQQVADSAQQGDIGRKDQDLAVILAAVSRLRWADLNAVLTSALKQAFVTAAQDAGMEAAESAEGAEAYAVGRVAEFSSIESASHWSVARATAKEIKALIETAASGGWTDAQLADAIRASRPFSAARAALIVQTELRAAEGAGRAAASAAAGAKRKRWVLGPEHPRFDECDGNAMAGEIPVDAKFPSGVMQEPSHPHCGCHVEYLMEDAA